MLLVTGGAGFIGSHVVDALVDAGEAVRVLDLRGPVAAGAEHIRGDVRDPDVVAAALEGVDAVCHQAAKVGLGVDLEDITDYVAHNDVGTAVLLRAMARAGTVRRLVLASSMVVYGEGRYRCPDHGIVRPGARRREDLDAGRYEPPCPSCGRALAAEAIAEDAPVDPRNVYAATKLHQEHLAAAFARETGVGVTALRYHNVYGPRMPRNTPYSGVAALFRSALERGEAPNVFEDGGQMRDFVHVSDVARANLAAIRQVVDAPDESFATYNVCSGTPVPIGRVAELVARGTGSDLTPQVSGRYRLGDVRHIVASPEKARVELGFEAAVPPEQGLPEFATAPLR
jgi:dTDP-L-rhamnose 4-epimerase